VGVWACGRLGVGACGRVGVWACVYACACDLLNRCTSSPPSHITTDILSDRVCSCACVFLYVRVS